MVSPPRPLRTTTAQAIANVPVYDGSHTEASSESVVTSQNQDRKEEHDASATDTENAPIVTESESPEQGLRAPASASADDSVPDGGYGWVVVAGCATLTFWFGGTTYSWGVMQAALVNEGLADASTLAFVGKKHLMNAPAYLLLAAFVK